MVVVVVVLAVTVATVVVVAVHVCEYTRPLVSMTT